MEKELEPDFFEKFGVTMAAARSSAGKSQEFIAETLGVAKKTVAKWEKGESCPTLDQAYNYFGCLGLNVMQYYLGCLYPQDFCNLDGIRTEEQVNKAIDKLGEILPMTWKRALLFILLGNHGSSPYGILQLTVAHLHTPLKDRVAHAKLVQTNYSINEQLGTLVNNQYIMPDTDVLNNAIRLATKSVVKKKGAYVCDKYTNLIKEGLLEIMDELAVEEIIEEQADKLEKEILSEAEAVSKTNPRRAAEMRLRVLKAKNDTSTQNVI